MEDITGLQDALSSNVTNSVTSSVQDELGKIIAWLVVPSIIITVVFVVLYVLHMLRRRKIENAILEMRDILRDMKLAGATPAKPWPKPETEPAAVLSSPEKPDDPNNTPT